ncbi:MAG: heme NO-binding domain-containing protein [Geminicoccaceae bacterium]
MKGIIFTEFLEHVESAFDTLTVEKIIVESNLPSGGAYTSVGTYDHAEIVQLVKTLSRISGTAPADLIRRFGFHLGKRFAEKFSKFFEAAPTLFDFLESVHDHIHVEVRKLYPDAELPSIIVTSRHRTRAHVRYCSPRGMEDLAVGLIKASAHYYGDRVDVHCKPTSDEHGDFVEITVDRTMAAKVA